MDGKKQGLNLHVFKHRPRLLEPVLAIDGFGKQPGNGCFSGTSRPGKQISMGNIISFYGVGQRLNHMLLPNDLREGLWPIFSV